MRLKRISLFLIVSLSCAGLSCQPKNEGSKASSDKETRNANAKGIWREEQIAEVAKAAEGPATQAVLSVATQKLKLGDEKLMSPERRELVIEVLYRIAATLEANKSLMPMEGEKTWLEEQQIKNVLKHLPDQKQFQVPDGAGGAVPLALNWEKKLLGILGSPHADFLAVTDEWIKEILGRLQAREKEGVFRNISLNDPGTVSAPAGSLSPAAATEEGLAKYAQVIDPIDPLENTKYEFDQAAVLLKQKNSNEPRALRTYRKDALLLEILGGGRVKSVFGGQGPDEVAEKDKKTIENAPRTCATTIRSLGNYTSAIDLEKQPRPYISRMAEKKRRNFTELGKFDEQQFCIGLVEHYVNSLAL